MSFDRCHSSGQECHNVPQLDPVAKSRALVARARPLKISTNKPRSKNCRSRTVPFSFERRPTKNPRAGHPRSKGHPPTQSRLKRCGTNDISRYRPVPTCIPCTRMCADHGLVFHPAQFEQATSALHSTRIWDALHAAIAEKFRNAHG